MGIIIASVSCAQGWYGHCAVFFCYIVPSWNKSLWSCTDATTDVCCIYKPHPPVFLHHAVQCSYEVSLPGTEHSQTYFASAVSLFYVPSSHTMGPWTKYLCIYIVLSSDLLSHEINGMDGIHQVTNCCNSAFRGYVIELMPQRSYSDVQRSFLVQKIEVWDKAVTSCDESHANAKSWVTQLKPASYLELLSLQSLLAQMVLEQPLHVPLEHSEMIWKMGYKIIND